MLISQFFSFEVIHEYDQHPIIKKYEDFLEKNKIGIAGIEFIVDESGNIWTYDVNTNTNYNSAAEQQEFGKMKAMIEIASYLESERKRIYEKATETVSPRIETNPTQKISIHSLSKSSWKLAKSLSFGFLERFSLSIACILAKQ